MITTMAAACAGACGGGGADGAKTQQVKSTGRAALAGTAYTSAQLQQALLAQPAGYKRVGELDAGEYGALKAVQNFEQLQRQVTLDKPDCAGAAGGTPGGKALDKTAPAAIASYGKSSGQTVTETLMAMPAEAAEQHVKAKVPAVCGTFRTRVGGKWSEHRVVESPSAAIGDGSRTVGISTRTGAARVKTWYVVVQGRRYLATVSLIGPNVTRAEAEQIARQADAQARRVLP
ncbi:hypothetical protein [Actinomadura sp. 21ATH]|uniref:hypothetical protein n=1 Tax=Actinomadura sp. 21ATH TaxID=1735444 RepID=UPI0035C1D8A6